jgi:hypothetical protein
LPLRTKKPFSLNVPSTQFEAALRALFPFTVLPFAPLLIFFALDFCFSSSSSLFGLQCSCSRSSFLFPTTTTTTTIIIIIISRRRRRSLRKKANAYLPSLRMKVPDHVYVLGHSYVYMSHVNKVQPIRVKMIRIAAIRVNFCLLLLSNGIIVGIGHTCNTMRVYHGTIITCATADSVCSLFPYPPPPQPALPHM